jgi:hypothetical protein
MARYIDADLIKEKLQRTIINGQTTFINNVLIGLLDKAPTEDVQKVKHGKWIWKELYGEVGYMLVCSNCEESEGARERFDYCPNCGAKMDGDVG